MWSIERKPKNRGVSRLILSVVVFLLFSFYAATILYAFGWGLLSSLKASDEFVFNMFGLPESWKFSNYIVAFDVLTVNGVSMVGLLWNSLWYTAGGTFLSVYCASTLSYVVAKYKFPGRNALYSLSVIILILPIVGALPATFRLIKTLGIDNSPLILLTFCNGFGFNFIVLYGFFRSVSWSYAEAAFMDGASHLRVFFRIMVPQALPAMLSLFVLAAIGVWNDYQGPLLYLEKMPTLSMGLYIFEMEVRQGGNYPILFAGLMISVLPILLLFIFFQETIMSNTVAGGLKG